MSHTVGNMWVSNDYTHNILCACREVFTNERIGTVVRMYAEHIVKEHHVN
jgi:hypothetical protein